MNSFRIFSRVARPATQTAFFTSSASHTEAAARTARRRMSGAEELIRTHGITVFKGLAVAGVSGAIISRFMMNSADAEAPGAAEGKAKTIFGRAGPVFTSLALQSAEDVNHNTKRLRFALPAEEDVSGLPLTCECVVGWAMMIYPNLAVTWGGHL